TPIADDAARALAASCLGAGADPAAAAALAAAAEGNPFFVEELARELRERGPAAGALPSTIEEVIQTRLDRLAPEERDLVRAAAYRRAGELAAGQRARGEAHRCYARAHALLGDAADGELLLELGEAATEAGAFAEAEPVLERAALALSGAPVQTRARVAAARA